MSARVSFSGGSGIKHTGTTVENEPVIKSDGAGAVTQWDNSTQGAGKGIYFVEGGSAGDPLRLGIGVAAPTVALDVAGATKFSGLMTATSATEAKLRLENTKDWGSSDSGNIGTLEFYTTDASGAGARVLGEVQCAQNAGSGAPNGELVFKTALGGGSSAAAVERMRISSDGTVTISKPQQTTTGTPFSGAALKLLPPSGGTTNTTGVSSIALSTSVTDNYGYLISGHRAGTDGGPTLRISSHSSSDTGTEVLTINPSGAVSISSGTLTVGSLDIGHGAGGVTTNTQLGTSALNSSSVGAQHNTALGYNSGTAVSGGDNNTLVGSQTGSAIVSGDDNTAIGYKAGTALTSANQNVAVGSGSLQTEDQGGNTVAVGFQALQDQNVNSANNTAIGSKAALNLTSGVDNVFVGYNASGLGTVTGNNNVVVGKSAGYTLTSGPGNVLIGRSAGAAMTTGDYNVAIGYQAADALTGAANSNIAIGHDAFGAVADNCSDCIAIGKAALKNQTGVSTINLAIGSSAGDAITNGTDNVFIGHEAGSAVTSNDGNTAVGHEAFKGGSGESNVVFGAYALDGASSGNYNTALGRSAMGASAAETDYNTAVGYAALLNINDNAADHNVALGYNAGRFTGGASQDAVTKAAQSIYIGSNSRAASISNDDNVIVIGYGANGQGDNSIMLGNSSVTDLYCYDTSIASPSDRRTKRDIADNNVGLDFIDRLATISYKRLNPADYPEAIREGRFGEDVEREELVEPAVEAAEAIYEDVVIPAKPAVTEERVVQEACEEIRGERQKCNEREVTETVTREDLSKIKGMWVRREITEDVTRTISEPVFEECDVYNEDGTPCMCCVQEARDAVTEERQVVDENGDGVVGEDGNPVMETVEIEPAVEAVYEPLKHKVPVMEEYVVQEARDEVRETVEIEPAVPEHTERQLVSEAVEAKEAVYRTETIKSDDRPADDDTVRLGLVAQDVQTAMADAGVEFDLVTESADGKLAIKYSNLVIPLLKAVQELSAEVKALSQG